MAPMAELPWLHAQVDPWRNRVVLAVQKFQYTWEPCGTIRSPTQFIAVYPDKSRELVGNVMDWSGHGNPAYVFPRPDGIYYSLTVNANTVPCEPVDRFLFGGFVNGAATETPVPCHPFMAVSYDGWIVRRIINADWSETFELGKLRLPPRVKIKDLGDEVEVKWDQQMIDDALQCSSDLQSWNECHFGPPPVLIQKGKQPQFYRVVQR
jgi:hypothetical protein